MSLFTVTVAWHESLALVGLDHGQRHKRVAERIGAGKVSACRLSGSSSTS